MHAPVLRIPLIDGIESLNNVGWVSRHAQQHALLGAFADGAIDGYSREAELAEELRSDGMRFSQSPDRTRSLIMRLIRRQSGAGTALFRGNTSVVPPGCRSYKAISVGDRVGEERELTVSATRHPCLGLSILQYTTKPEARPWTGILFDPAQGLHRNRSASAHLSGR